LMMETKIIQAIGFFGSQTALAKHIGVSPQAVQQWVQRNIIPAEHCPVIERLTDGKVRCEDLNPEIDWAFLRTTCKPELTPVETT
jgi:DNA-binding transcriptional regulator YdaS (Cro superfamily)